MEGSWKSWKESASAKSAAKRRNRGEAVFAASLVLRALIDLTLINARSSRDKLPPVT